MIERLLHKRILNSLKPQKVLILYGPRRVGKTTLLRQIANEFGPSAKIFDGEDARIQDIFSSYNLERLQQFIGTTSLLILDEAQKIPHIGSSLKLIADHIPGIRVIVSGSASFSLAERLGEPLTGRKITFCLYPMSLRELIAHHGIENQKTFLEMLMIFGGYPEILQLSDDQKAQYMKEIIDSYLFRDILNFENIRNPLKLRDLLKLLAFQIGSEVSLHELGRQLDLSKNTVFRYLDLLEKSFVIINIRGLSRNLRSEVTKTSRYYFYDNGIRNALIQNFNPLSLRNDTGQLWENCMVIERLKKQSYENIMSNNYFWRTYSQQEIDFVEEREGKLFGYEMKWNSEKVRKNPPPAWKQAYPDASYENITGDHYQDFI